ncbi:hypothetical protein [Pseudonocardia oroxyli]|uniref:hypothetical protein n=1 Tax=Pseudonocardia oroxyli TaxID=366584 RepID=UPI00115FDB50|nr:hypothetical protein [Pseudonocardia oroxyli]
MLDPAADAEARALLALTDWDPETGGTDLDAEIGLAAAWLYWCRAQAHGATADDEAEVDVAIAVALFTPLHADYRELLPPELCSLLEADDLPPSDPGMVRYHEHLASGDSAALDDAVDLLRVTAIREDAPRHWSNLCGAMRLRYLIREARADVDDAVDAGRRAVERSDPDDPELASRLSNLGSALLARHDGLGCGNGDHDGDPDSDLDGAVEALRGAVDHADHDDPQRPVFQANLAAVLSTRFAWSGRQDDIDQAVAICRSALAMGLPDDETLAAALSTLGATLRARHSTGDAISGPADLDEAVEVGKWSVQVAPGEPTALINLASTLSARFELGRDVTDLTRAEEAARDALAHAHTDASAARTARDTLSTVLQARFDQTGEPVVLDEAVDLLSADLDGLIHDGRGDDDGQTLDRQTPDRLLTASSAFLTRYEATGRIADLDDAVALAERAAAHTAAGHPLRRRALLATASVLQTRAALRGAPADLTAAIRAARAAFADGPRGRTEHVGVRTILAAVLLDEFEAGGGDTVLAEAMERLHEAMRRSDGTVDHALCLSSLSAALSIRFEVAGRPDDLHEAVRTGRLAVAETPETSWQRPLRLGTLAAALRTRYEAFGALDDLREAVERAREAVASAPPGSPARVGNLSTLSGALQTLWIGPGEDSGLDEAVASAREAVATTDPADRRLAGRLSNLASALQARAVAASATARGSASAADLDEAADVALRAVSAAAPGSLDHAGMLSNVARTLWLQYRARGTRSDLDAAIDAGRAAVGMTPPDHPDRTTYLHNLAEALADRSRGNPDDSDRADLDAALEAFGEAAAIATAPPIRRLFAARAAGRLAASTGRGEAAAANLAAAVRLIPAATWPGLDRPSQELNAASTEGVTGEAVAWALGCGTPTTALELCELGRSVLWTHSIDARVSPAALQVVAPGLAIRLAELSAARNRAAVATSGRL